jgi:hypothetical protein
MRTRGQLEGLEKSEEWEVVVRWSPACEDVSLRAEERPLLEDVTKQSSEDSA